MGGSTEVNVVADPNVQFKSRETTLNFSAGGGLSKSILATQDSFPYLGFFPTYNYSTGYNFLSIGDNGQLIITVNLGLSTKPIGYYMFWDFNQIIENIEFEIFDGTSLTFPKGVHDFTISESVPNLFISGTVSYFIEAVIAAPSIIKSQAYIKTWINDILVQEILLNPA